MEKVKRFDTVKQYNEHVSAETLHPLVSVVKFNEIPTILNMRAHFGVYAIFLKDITSDLSFKYQQHFTRLFKQKTGLTPNEYRNIN